MPTNPIAPPSPPPQPQPPKPTPTASPQRRAASSDPVDQRKHIVVIEDDHQMRAMLTQMLRQEGYRVSEFADSYQWMNFCVMQTEGGRQYMDYDLVICDIRMPGISGMEVLEGLQHSDRNPPTILITAFGDPQTHARARQLGARAVLDKPFATRELLELVAEYCGGGDDAAPPDPSGRAPDR